MFNTIAAASLAMLAIGGFAQPASAAGSGNITTYFIINQSTVSTSWVQRNQVIGYCVALTSGGTCTITSGKSSTTTIGLDLGVTRGQVAGSINYSSASTRTVAVGCKSPALTAGQRWNAYAVGTYKLYQVKRLVQNTAGTTTTISNNLGAFQASGNGIACGTS